MDSSIVRRWIARANQISRNTQQQERFEGVISDSVVVNEMGAHGYLTTWKVTKRPRGRREPSANINQNNILTQQQRLSQNTDNRTTPPPFNVNISNVEKTLKTQSENAEEQLLLALELAASPPISIRAKPRNSITIKELLS